LLLNNFLLTTAAASVLLGTLYPLFLDAMGGGKVSVGAPYFTRVFVPLMAPLVLAMGFGPFLGWKRGDLAGVVSRLKWAIGLTLAAVVITWVWVEKEVALPALGMALAVWLMAATLTEFAGRIRLFREPLAASLRRVRLQPRASWGMTLAHGGLAIAIAGMTASSAWRVEKIQIMRPGESVEVAGYHFAFQGAREVAGPNYRAVRGRFAVSRAGRPVVTLDPEKRTYLVRGMPTTEAAIHPTFLGDLYAVIGDAKGDDGGFVTRLYFNPLVPWMWVGGLVMVLGAGISLTDRRHRVGVPARRRKAAAGGARAGA
jgi:cytochrome c-type biogenesis protein CcmF